MARSGPLIYPLILALWVYTVMSKLVKRGFLEGGLPRYRAASPGTVYRGFWGHEPPVLSC